MTSSSTADKGITKVATFFWRRRARFLDMIIEQDEDVEQRLTEDVVISERKGAEWQRTCFPPN